MHIDIDGLTREALIDLNNRIVARLRLLDQMQAHASMLTFRIGERVTFTPDARGPVSGVLVKYNRKSVTVLTDSGERWTVAPGLLNKALEAERSRGKDNVFPIK